MTASSSDKAARFRALHQGPGAFVIPNPWDAGSARILAALGFPALATSSGAQAGVLGRAAIEDATGSPDTPLSDIGLATDRVAAAVQAARALPFAFTLTARAEGFLRGSPNLDEVIKRLQAYEQAGADVLFAPGLPD